MKNLLLTLVVLTMSMTMVLPATAADDIVFGIERDSSGLYEINLTTSTRSLGRRRPA